MEPERPAHDSADYICATRGITGDCDVTENGIPDDAVATIDPGGVRHALANVGFALGGFYVGETFGNPSGGTKQGAANHIAARFMTIWIAS